MSIADDKKRLVLEHAAMRERWGDAPRWCCDRSRRHFWWESEVRLEGNVFLIKIVYPDEYPAKPPDILIETPLPLGTPHLLPVETPLPFPHLLPGRKMCWYYPGESKRNRNIWNPSRDTAAMAMGVAYRWFLSFLVWEATGEWPFPDATD